MVCVMFNFCLISYVCIVTVYIAMFKVLQQTLNKLQPDLRLSFVHCPGKGVSVLECIVVFMEKV